jgi:DNA-binding NtrC family response regulator
VLTSEKKTLPTVVEAEPDTSSRQEAKGAPAGLDLRAGCLVSEMEKQLIQITLAETNGNRTHAARLLGISLRTLRNKLREYRLAEELVGVEDE